MVLAAEAACLLWREYERVRREPDEESGGYDEGDVLYIFVVAFPFHSPLEAAQKVIICRQEQRPYEHRLYYEEPGEKPAHERYAHLLAVGVYLCRKPVPGEWQRQKGAYCHEVGRVSHPVVMRLLVTSFRPEEPVGSVRRHYRPAVGYVRAEPVQVHGAPEVVSYGVPDIAVKDPGDVYPGGRHHERDPRVGYEH